MATTYQRKCGRCAGTGYYADRGECFACRMAGTVTVIRYTAAEKAAIKARDARIAAARAASLRRRLDRALGEIPDVEGEETPLDLACGCGGRLVSVSGSSTVAVRCKGCGIAWNGAALAAQVRAGVA